MIITDIIAELNTLCDSNDTSYPSADKLRRINFAYEYIIMLIQGCDGLWQFDDQNYTDFPIGTTTLVNSQNDYAFDSAMLEIERAEVKDISGIWQILYPIDKSQINEAIDEFYKTDGLPLYYDKQGASIILYPAPDNGVSVTLASGLKIYFKRTASIFTAAEVTTGTKVPGFASPYHMILAYMAAIPYCQSYKKDRVPILMAEVERLKKLIIQHYGRREQDRRKLITTAGINHR